MQQECSCGDNCAVCEKCDLPQCECYCDFELDKELEKDDNEDENEDEMNW